MTHVKRPVLVSEQSKAHLPPSFLGAVRKRPTAGAARNKDVCGLSYNRSLVGGGASARDLIMTKGGCIRSQQHAQYAPAGNGRLNTDGAGMLGWCRGSLGALEYEM